MDEKELEELHSALAAEFDLAAILDGLTWDFDDILAGFNLDLCEVMAEFG
jgi:hypothetical protein